MRVLGLIPARGGSKGVPRKNLRPLGGKPLLQYTIESALAAESLARIVLTTDDPEIADLGRKSGVSVPFLRPPDLARDETPMLPVVQHALRELEAEGDRYDAVCLLQPTTPFRRSEDIDGCIARLIDSGADSVVSIAPVPTEYNPYWTYLERADGFLGLALGGDAPITRRQDLPPAYHRDGSIYVTRSESVLGGDSLYGARLAGYLIEREGQVNIDTLQDWMRAERIAAGGNR